MCLLGAVTHTGSRKMQVHAGVARQVTARTVPCIMLCIFSNMYMEGCRDVVLQAIDGYLQAQRA
jgi:hypothetical protein